MLTEHSRRARAQLAQAHARAKRQPGDPANAELIAERQRQFRYVSAEDYITRLVEAAPPLTDDQRDRLALLLRPRATPLTGGGETRRPRASSRPTVGVASPPTLTGETA